MKVYGVTTLDINYFYAKYIQNIYVKQSTILHNDLRPDSFGGTRLVSRRSSEVATSELAQDDG
jgi:hypothetical protein